MFARFKEGERAHASPVGRHSPRKQRRNGRYQRGLFTSDPSKEALVTLGAQPDAGVLVSLLATPDSHPALGAEKSTEPACCPGSSKLEKQLKEGNAHHIRHQRGPGAWEVFGIGRLILWITLNVIVVYIVLEMLGYRKLFLTIIGGWISSFSPDFAVTASKPDLVPYKFSPLPLGSIAPRGWLESQLELMANGLAGHEHDFYRFVSDSPWLGGFSEYSQLHEGFPYWLNGIVPLAYSINDPRLKAQIKSSVQIVIDNQFEDGWLGPEKIENGTRNLWGRYPLLMAFTQLLEADESYADTVLPAMRDFIDLTYTMLKNNGTGYLFQAGDKLSEEDHGWARIRVADFMFSLQWLYENDEEGDQADQLMEIMGILRKGALDWGDWYTDERYLKGDLNWADPAYLNESFPYEHGVNVGQGLKWGAVINRFEHNATMVNVARRSVDWTFTYHGAPSGGILADERLEGLSPFYGSELCTTVEAMYSLSYLYQAIGDRDFADRAETAAFNALPAAVTGDWWAHQYVTQPNQPYAEVLGDPEPFWNVNGRGQAFGLEPNYPCCTVNHPQGYPKFVSHSWVAVGRQGLGHALLSPSTVETTLENGAKVTIDVTTNYPFSDVLHYDISASDDFTLYVRIPSWSKSALWSYRRGFGESALAEAHTDSSSGLLPIRVSAGNSKATIHLRRSIDIIPRANNSVSIAHGPLLYTLDVGYEATSSFPKYYFSTTEPIASGEIPPESRDWVVTNTSAWNIAIDTSTIVVKSAKNADVNADSFRLNDQIWSPGAPPTYLEAQGCEIEWPLYRGVPGPVPLERKCISGRRKVRLVPVGSAKIGMAELPTL